MTQIFCPECHNTISSQANSCPHCGQPVDQSTVKTNTEACPNCHSVSTQNILESVLRGVIILITLAIIFVIIYLPLGLILFTATILFILYGLKNGRHAWYCKDCKHIWKSKDQHG